MHVNINFFEQKLVHYVEKNHLLDVERIVEGWEVPTYNLTKELGNSNGKKYCSYVFNLVLKLLQWPK